MNYLATPINLQSEIGLVIKKKVLEHLQEFSCFLLIVGREQGLVNFFYKGPDSKHFRLCLCHSCSTLLLQQNSHNTVFSRFQEYFTKHLTQGQGAGFGLWAVVC